MSTAEWRRIMDVNLDGLFWCCRAFGGQMLKVAVARMQGRRADARLQVRGPERQEIHRDGEDEHQAHLRDELALHGVGLAQDEGSVRTHSGSNLVLGVGRSLTDAERAAVAKIAEALGSEQAEGVNQITSAMGHLNTATQQNASAAEQLSATAEELSAQATASTSFATSGANLATGRIQR